MADLTSMGGFNASEVEPAGEFEALPAGDYEVCIVNSDWQLTKSGNGRMLLLELQVLRGPHANRKLWDRLNLENPNAQAVQIARGTLSAICRAVDVLTPKDSSELHGKALMAVVKVEDSPDYGKRNVVRGYKPAKKMAAHVKREEVERDNEIPF